LLSVASVLQEIVYHNLLLLKEKILNANLRKRFDRPNTLKHFENYNMFEAHIEIMHLIAAVKRETRLLLQSNTRQHSYQ